MLQPNIISGPCCRELLSMMATALAFLHVEVWVVHHDVKPGNILIAQHKSLCVHLADFGLAKELCLCARRVPFVAVGGEIRQPVAGESRT